eukprot:m.91115 g.91115  ORF g.91115 m.91115 type:complete len:1386 (-) comp16486_c0_seq5:3519-7676(-)
MSRLPRSGYVQLMNVVRHVIVPLLVDVFMAEYDQRKVTCNFHNAVHPACEIVPECILHFWPKQKCPTQISNSIKKIAFGSSTGRALFISCFDPEKLEWIYRELFGEDFRTSRGGIQIMIENGRNAFAHVLFPTPEEADATQQKIKQGLDLLLRSFKPSFDVWQQHKAAVAALTELELEPLFVEHLRSQLQYGGLGAFLREKIQESMLEVCVDVAKVLCNESKFSTKVLVILPEAGDWAERKAELDFLRRVSLGWTAVLDLAGETPIWSEKERQAVGWQDHDADDPSCTQYCTYKTVNLGLVVQTQSLVVFVGGGTDTEERENTTTARTVLTTAIAAKQATLLAVLKSFSQHDSPLPQVLQDVGPKVCNFILLEGLVLESKGVDELLLLPGANPKGVRTVTAHTWMPLMQSLEILTTDCDIVASERVRLDSSVGNGEVSDDETTVKRKHDQHVTQFLRGTPAHWCLYRKNVVVARAQLEGICDWIRAGSSVTLLHMFKDGGTTLARHVAYRLRHEFVVVYVTKALSEQQMEHMRQQLQDATDVTCLQPLVVIDLDTGSSVESARMSVSLKCLQLLVEHVKPGDRGQLTDKKIRLEPLTTQEQIHLRSVFPTLFRDRDLMWEGFSLKHFIRHGLLDVRKLKQYYTHSPCVELENLFDTSRRSPTLLHRNGFFVLEIHELADTRDALARLEFASDDIPMLHLSMLYLDTEGDNYHRLLKTVSELVSLLSDADLDFLKAVVFFSLFAPTMVVPVEQRQLGPVFRLFVTAYRVNNSHAVRIDVPQLAYELAWHQRLFGKGPNGFPLYLMDYIRTDFLAAARKKTGTWCELLVESFCYFNLWHWLRAPKWRRDRFPFLVQLIGYTTSEKESIAILQNVCHCFLSRTGHQSKQPGFVHATTSMVTHTCRIWALCAGKKNYSMVEALVMLDDATKLLDKLPNARKNQRALFSRGDIHRRRLTLLLRTVDSSKDSCMSAEFLRTLATSMHGVEDCFLDAAVESGYSWANPFVALVQTYLDMMEKLMAVLSVNSVSALVDRLEHCTAIYGSFGWHLHRNTLNLLMTWLRQAKICSKFISRGDLFHAKDGKTEEYIQDCCERVHELETLTQAAEYSYSRAQSEIIRHPRTQPWELTLLVKCLASVGVHLSDSVDTRTYILLEEIVELCTAVPAQEESIDKIRAKWSQTQNCRQATEALSTQMCNHLVPLVNKCVVDCKSGEAYGLTPRIVQVMLHLDTVLQELDSESDSEPHSVKRLCTALTELENDARNYFNVGSTRFFVVRDAFLPSLPLTRFVAVHASKVLSVAKRDRDVEHAYAEAFHAAHVRVFSGKVVESGKFPSVESEALPGVSIRFHRSVSADIGDEVMFGIGVKDRSLWAHGVTVCRAHTEDADDWI